MGKVLEFNENNISYLVQCEQLPDLNVALVLVDIDDLELPVSVLGAGLKNLEEFLLVGLNGGPCIQIIGSRHCRH